MKEPKPILGFVSKNETIHVKIYGNASKYELIGIVESWLQAYKKEVVKDWCED